MAGEGKNRHYHWDRIHARHWIETARRCGVAGMPAILADLVARTPAVIETVEKNLPNSFPSQLADTLFSGVRRAAKRLQEELLA